MNSDQSLAKAFKGKRALITGGLGFIGSNLARALVKLGTHPLRPVDMNGINKLAGEEYHSLYCRVHGIRSTVLRLTNTIGPRMRVKGCTGNFCRSVDQGCPARKTDRSVGR